MNGVKQMDYEFKKLLATDQPKKLEDRQKRLYEPYLPDENLVEAVNLAIRLRRPLLLEGKPGSGKTQLANNLVYQLSKANLWNDNEAIETRSWWPFYIWNVKSYNRVRDGLYTFDAVDRLRDAQIASIILNKAPNQEAAAAIQQNWENPIKYRKFGPLGKAIQEPDRRAVLLIDEIDKADSDFTNDLLLELDKYRFDVAETGELDITATHEPIVILTSNQEKPLPDAFLRRCLYFNIEFPKKAQLIEIAKQRFTIEDDESQEILLRSIEEFSKVRKAMVDNPGSKAPGTSEFLEFLKALYDCVDTQAKREAILNNLAQRRSFLGVLLKKEADIELYINEMGGR
jgi:MoxR-like ATPase